MDASKTRGRLLTIEGIDGCGKTTQCRLLVEALKQSNRHPIYCKEPTEGPYGQKIRKISQQDRKLPVDEEIQLFMADRKWNVENHILPALGRGDIVVMDRYYYSTAAYQGIRSVEWRGIIRQNEAFAPRPDLVLILDLDPQLGLDRIAEHRGGVFNPYFERLDELKMIKKIFDQIKGGHIYHLDASTDIETLHKEIVRLTESLFK